MPLFEYTCRDCGSRFETLTSRAEADRAACPRCGSRKTARQLSTFSAAVASSAPSCATGQCSLPAGGCGPGGCSTGACPFGSNGSF